MAQEFRYSLTRICLRTGQLSLSQRMAEIFPESGSVTALDTVDDREIDLTAVGPRRVTGMAEYFRRHKLEVNDAVSMRTLPDGRVALTAIRRRSRRDYGDPKVVGELLDSLLGEKPRTEAEIRALHPDLPDGFPLIESLQEDSRFHRHAGRWEAASATGLPRESGEEASVNEAETEATTGAASEAGAATYTGAPSAAETEPDAEVPPGAATEAAATEAATKVAAEATETATESTTASTTASTTESFTDERDRRTAPAGGAQFGAAAESAAGSEPGGYQQTGHPLPGRHPDSSEERAQRRRARLGDSGRRSVSGGEHREATDGGLAGSDREGGTVRRAAVTPYPRGVMFPGEAALNSKGPGVDLKSVNRARDALGGFGYRVEGLSHGMLLARAELGRRQHTVLVRVLVEGERLDWAALLARRREQSADHLAVFGDHRDLHRLTAPAELARATLWSWDGIARVQTLAENILIGPFDLEPHFEKGGMFGPGLQLFETSISRLIAERGVLSAVLSRLAVLRAPSVFVLDDLVEPEISREEVAATLALLSQAPFHLIARVDKGEYCLRHHVSDGLLQLSEYALSLRERLPRHRRERLAGASPAEANRGNSSATGSGSAKGESEQREVPEDATA